MQSTCDIVLGTVLSKTTVREILVAMLDKYDLSSYVFTVQEVIGNEHFLARPDNDRVATRMSESMRSCAI